MSGDRPGPLQFFHSTRARPCPYLPGRHERSIAAELDGDGAQEIYDAACAAGFRRSHGFIYRPACADCDACMPVRIVARDFSPRRSFARILKRNADLTGRLLPALATAEQFALFSRYQKTRHASAEAKDEPGSSEAGGMDRMTRSDYTAMIEDSPVDSHVVEYRGQDGVLHAAMLTDRVADGLSAVYSFFAPDEDERSLGSYMILDLVRRAQAEGLPYVYLGYLIAETPKMAYKARFQPLEALGPDGWKPLKL
ncbi:MAG TPA: arginyltransferase [Alphaproteobacteria bacterium]|nr:arginyltransferase [Alphaproteobacteria bacterium]